VSKHRALVRPRWGRIGASTAAAGVVAIALVGAFGGFSTHHQAAAQALDPAPPTAPVTQPQPAAPAGDPASDSVSDSPAAPDTTPSTPTPRDPTAMLAPPSSGSSADSAPDPTALPTGSGTGRRAVYDISDQRVWIVGSDGKVQRTYPVSGSLEDNLKTGTYAVYSRSRWAVGVDDSGVMQYFVRFAHGTDEGAAIGFHSIPTKNGKPLQTAKQLGTPQSHGCIRQKTDDAIAMWDFAQDGTKVVVLA
jgi:lipoprotein-anchoring transpeptidase ErfK/SrfK